MNAARIAENLNSASDALSGERGAEAALASALKKLSRLQEEARKRIVVCLAAERSMREGREIELEL